MAIRRSKKPLTGQDALEQIQSITIEMMARTNDQDLVRFARYLDSTKASTANISLLLVCLYSQLVKSDDDLELNALFQEAFMLCGQTANDYKTIRNRLAELEIN